MRLSRSALGLLAAAAIALAVMRTSAAEGKRLSVYAPQKQYDIALADENGREYIALDELMSPLGTVAVQSQGNTVRLKVNAVNGTFNDGKTAARIGNAIIELEGKAHIQDGRLLVPAKSIPMLLVQYLHAEVDFHETARRLFIGGSPQHFVLSARKEGELALSFPSPVTPQITSEGNKLTLVFRKEPLIGADNDSTFANKLISGVEWSEGDGAATLTVHGTSPLLASFADGGKSIVITPAPAQAAQSGAPQTSATAPTNVPASPATPSATSATPPLLVAPQAGGTRFVVVIDPAHGGDDKGALLADGQVEKDVTLAMARKLSAELQSHGVAAMLLRDSDVTRGAEQRAELANAQVVGMYVGLHAEAARGDVGIYTALVGGTQSARRFLSWQSAQQAQIERSKALASSISAELVAKKLQVPQQPAPVAPLRMVSLPAVAVDVSPNDDGEYSTKYEQSVVSSLAAGIANARVKLEAQR